MIFSFHHSNYLGYDRRLSYHILYRTCLRYIFECVCVILRVSEMVKVINYKPGIARIV